MTDVFDVVFHHDEAVDAAAERKAGVDVRVNSSSFHDIRVNHAATEQLNPFAV